MRLGGAYTVMKPDPLNGTFKKGFIVNSNPGIASGVHATTTDESCREWECCRKVEVLKPVTNKGMGSWEPTHCTMGAILRKPYSLTDTGYGETIKSVLIDNIHKFGNLYARYQNIF